MPSPNTVVMLLSLCGCLATVACSDDDSFSQRDATEPSAATDDLGDVTQTPAATGTTESTTEQSNLALVESALTGLYDDANPEVLGQYWIEDFAQHNPTGPNGTAFMKELFIDNRPESFAVERGLRMADGDFVAVHSRIVGFGEPLMAFDVYKIQDDRIIAHWDSIQLEVPATETANGNSMQTTENSYPPVSEEQEKINADIVRESFDRLVGQADSSAIDELFAEDYIQHSPDSPNGVEALRDSIADFGQLPDSFSYEIGFVMADGPFVAVQSRYVGVTEVPLIALDIYRLEDGLISEHWDILQDEVAVENTVSGNSMFPIQ